MLFFSNWKLIAPFINFDNQGINVFLRNFPKFKQYKIEVVYLKISYLENVV